MPMMTSPLDSSESLKNVQPGSLNSRASEETSPARSRLPAALYTVELTLLLSAASVLAARDDRFGRTALPFLTPVILALEPFGAELVRSAHTVVPVAGLSLSVVLAIVAIASLAGRGSEPRVITLAGAAAVTAGEIALVESWVAPGVILLCVSLAVLTLFWFSRLQSERHSAALGAREDAGFSWCDFFSLSLVTVIAIVFRFYALNRVFNSFEGELSPYMAGATSLRGMLHANVGGEGGPWAPLGYFYYLPIFVTSKLFGTTVLAIRLASAIVSTLTVPLVYGLLRRLSGSTAALIGAFFIALDPLQVGWGRSDIHPHGSTELIAILLVWACVNAAEYGRYCDFFAVALLMGLACHQYPSGQVAVLIPPAFFLWNLVWRSEGDSFVSGRAAVALVVGLALWTLGFRLQYFLAYGRSRFPDLLTIFGARTSWAASGGSDASWHRFVAIGDRLVANARDLVWGVFTQVPYLFHQEWIPEFPNLSTRSVFWIAAAMAWLGALRLVRCPRDKRAAVLLLWAVCGSLPAVLSAQAYAKRAAIMYPAIYALAAMTLAFVRKEIATTRARSLAISAVEGSAAILVITASLFQWFSGTYYPYGEPREVTVAQKVEDLLKPGTIVISDFTEDYQRGKLTYLLLDALKSERVRPVAWYVLNEGLLSFASVLDDPRRAIHALRRTHWYNWTDLWDQLPETEAYTKWSRVLFLFQGSSWDPASRPMEQHRQRVLDRCSGGGAETLDAAYPSPQFYAIECDLGSLTAGSRPKLGT